MASYRRSEVTDVIRRLKEPPRHIIAVFGPRQTGKTTLVQQALSSSNLNHTYLSADEPIPPIPPFSTSSQSTVTFPTATMPDAGWLVRNWEDARLEIDRSRQTHVLAIDEIQKIPNWSEIVKGLWDADRLRGLPLHVIILGSAPLLMQAGLSESLAGRFEPVRVTHWSFQEMYDAFNFTLPQYLYFGGYPGAAALIHEPHRWRDYIIGALIEPNIERDILSMTRVDKPALIKQLFELGASYSGQILSFNKMLGQLHDAGNTTTLARYLELLSSAGLLTGFHRWSSSPQRRRASSPKLNVLNTALMTAGSGYSFEEAQADRTYWGRIVESAVGAHLTNTATSDMRVCYWRQNSLEVDFVLQRGARIGSFEVKSGDNVGALRGFHQFEKLFAPEISLIVGGEGVPLNEFLSIPADEWLDTA